jgi:hypothetical protein
MNANPNHPQFGDSDLDQALSSAGDSILPSSGFTEGVMTAVLSDAAAPAPLAFPWRRALPGLAGVAIAVVLLVAAIVSVLRSGPLPDRIVPNLYYRWVANAGSGPMHSSDALWLVVSLSISVACLFLCRHLIRAR